MGAKRKQPEPAKSQPNEPPEPVALWPDADAVCEQLGCSTHALRRYVSRGMLTRYDTPYGSRYNPDQVEELRSVNAAGGKAGAGSSEELGVGEALRALVDTQRAHAEAVKASGAHLESMVKLLVEPAHRVLELLSAENDRLRTHNAKLEESHYELVRAREAALNETTERELAAKHMEAKEQWRARTFHLLQQSAPKLLAKINGEHVDEMSELVRSLEDEQILGLKHAGLVSDEQASLLLSIREKLRRSMNGKKGETENAQQS